MKELLAPESRGTRKVTRETNPMILGLIDARRRDVQDAVRRARRRGIPSAATGGRVRLPYPAAQ